jgi:hypothetical protein
MLMVILGGTSPIEASTIIQFMADFPVYISGDIVLILMTACE